MPNLERQYITGITIESRHAIWPLLTRLACCINFKDQTTLKDLIQVIATSLEGVSLLSSSALLGQVPNCLSKGILPLWLQCSEMYSTY